MASATSIPLPDDSVSLIGSCDVFPSIRDFDRAAAEMRRVSRPGAHLACSIANARAHKYTVIGPNRDFVNAWTYDEFPAAMSRHGFTLVDRTMMGRWVPTPRRIIRGTWHFPLSSPHEPLNCNFIYLFQLRK